MIRLRQVALVAADLETVAADLFGFLGLGVAYRDPLLAEFGVENVLGVVGDQFLEVISPTRADSTAQRLLDRRSGDGGYMAIFEVDDIDRRTTALEANGVRIVWSAEFDEIRARHLHPRDVGGALVSIDQPEPLGSWHWAGPDWRPHTETTVVQAIAGVGIAAEDPAAMRTRWEMLELAHGVEFISVTERGEGIDRVDLVASDRSRAGESTRICGVELRLV